MDEKAVDFPASSDWKVKVLVVGLVIGAAVGLAAAYLLAQNAEKQGTRPELTAGDGVKLGVLVFGLLRSVASMVEGK